jgi:hypothetical protein
MGIYYGRNSILQEKKENKMNTQAYAVKRNHYQSKKDVQDANFRSTANANLL